ncbi:sugar utilization regulatory protein IMP2 [Kluyveromyces marxianus]|uniref:Sugar utilization regulatory protein IMP2 n=1 Tax=Kluyveromyces marxianus TaxID=4911 RepID=A0ABX6EVV1_KLUMA|nr:sugar utilization regulatory protein IMP2 [Kluyveromyces marxianus]
MDEPGRGILNKKQLNDVEGVSAPPLFPSIKIEEPEQRGRSRSKNRDPGATSNRSLSNRSLSRSLSRVSIKEQAHLKWTILNRDPSERLHKHYKNNKNDISKEEEEDDDDDEDDEQELSDEEQVSDVDNEIEIDEHLEYDLGSKVLPNFVTSITKVLDTMKPWLAKNAESKKTADKRDIKMEEIQNGIYRALYFMSKSTENQNDDLKDETSEQSVCKSEESQKPNHTFVLYLDQMDESFGEKIYTLIYTFGSVLNNGDTLYIINQCDDDKNDMLTQLNRICDHVEYLFESTNGVGTLDNVDVVICSMYHPYPKQLLTEMAFSLQATTIIVPLQTVLSSLQNFITSVPMLVVRKKLKRSKRRGITD